MLGAYLVVAGVLVIVASYVTFINFMLTRGERRDLAALDTPCRENPAHEHGCTLDKAA